MTRDKMISDRHSGLDLALAKKDNPLWTFEQGRPAQKPKGAGQESASHSNIAGEQEKQEGYFVQYIGMLSA